MKTGEINELQTAKVSATRKTKARSGRNRNKACDSVTRVILVRHGQTVWNSQGRWQGWLDSPLTELGREQARQAREALRGETIHVAYSSPSGRAFETAQIITEPHGVDVITHDGLRERYYGGYEGLNSPEIEKKYPGSRYYKGRDTREDWRPPGGETMAEVRARMEKLFDEVLPRHAGQTVLMVTHSGVVRAVDSLCAQTPLDNLWHRVPRNACVFVIEYSPASGLSIVKDHLE